MTPAPGQRHGVAARAEGAWPFITRLSYGEAGRESVRLARQHRRGLGRPDEGTDPPFWQSPGYNWWTGAFFAVGSFLFMLGSVFALMPPAAAPASFVTNIVFFLGSVPFTIAAYLQLFQAANAPDFIVARQMGRPGGAIAGIGWRPGNLGWLSSFTQFIGTIAFNASTLNAILVSSGARVQDIAVWAPDMVGSVMFLVSGYLAFIETSHGYWSWKPRDLAWQIVFVNLLGCIFFMTAGIFAYVPGGPEAGWISEVANGHLLLGALGFFIGAVLSMHESRLAA